MLGYERKSVGSEDVEELRLGISLACRSDVPTGSDIQEKSLLNTAFRQHV